MSGPWWMEQMALHDDYRTMLWRARTAFDDDEFDNFGWIAEQLWAQGQGLA